MKIGIYYDFNEAADNLERLKQIAAIGFTHAPLWIGGKIDSAAKSKLPGQVQQAGMEVDNIHADFGGASALWLDTLEWEDVAEEYFGYMDLCSNNQVPIMIVHLTDPGRFPPPNQLGVDRMKRFVERAEKKNVSIALENLENHHYLRHLFDRIYSDNLGFCYDSGHENCWTNGENLLERYGGLLMALHLHDNDGSGDQHKLPGDGTVNWIQVAIHLRQCKFTGPIVLEVQKGADYQGISEEKFLQLAYKQVHTIATSLATSTHRQSLSGR